jgi:hypothetical protein
MLKYILSFSLLLMVVFATVFYMSTKGWGYPGSDVKIVELEKSRTRTYTHSSGPSFWYHSSGVSYYQGDRNIRGTSTVGGGPGGGGK